MATPHSTATPPVASRTATPSRDTGSRTMELTEDVVRLSAPSGVLRLRAEPSERRHIQWAEDVVDNEGMGKKSSKVCCIYHKPRAADESSDDSSSDSSSDDSDSDSEPDNSTARPAGKKVPQRGRPEHDHDGCEEHDHDHDHGEGAGKSQKRRKQRRNPSPNAYEKMPKNKK
jgi:protein phosphatase 1 regulatory subunit 11